jgi:hypothetical protein
MARVLNATAFPTPALREFVRAGLRRRRAFRRVRAVSIVTAAAGSRADREDDVDGVAEIDANVITLYIPPDWRVISDNRARSFAQTLDHEIFHILFPDAEHIHMPNLWTEPVPHALGVYITRG